MQATGRTVATVLKTGMALPVLKNISKLACGAFCMRKRTFAAAIHALRTCGIFSRTPSMLTTVASTVLQTSPAMRATTRLAAAVEINAQAMLALHAHIQILIQAS